MRIVSYIIILLIVLLGVSFATLNPSPVTINFFISQKILPLSLLMAYVFSIGCLLGLLVGFWVFIKMKFKNYRLRQQLKIVEKEVENLRAIPLQDKH